MPWSIDEGKAMIAEYLNEMITDEEMVVLDLGCGQGTYGKLIQKPCYKIGVDAVDYYREYGLMMIYDKFCVHDIRDTVWLKTLNFADICVCGDVLEHLSVEEAKAVLGALEAFCGAIIVALPFRWKQDDWNGWEGHKQADLTPEIVAKRYPELKPIRIYTNRKKPWFGDPYYGYYIWRREDV